MLWLMLTKEVIKPSTNFSNAIARNYRKNRFRFCLGSCPIIIFPYEAAATHSRQTREKQRSDQVGYRG